MGTAEVVKMQPRRWWRKCLKKKEKFLKRAKVLGENRHEYICLFCNYQTDEIFAGEPCVH